MGNCLAQRTFSRDLVVNGIHGKIGMPPDCTVEELQRALMQKWTVEKLQLRNGQVRFSHNCPRRVSHAFPSGSTIVVEAIFEQNAYECPIVLEIMVDPVQCSDGFVYERSSIESHIQIRQKMETLRLARDENDEEQDETRCGGPRGAIRVTSPCTNDELTSLHLVSAIELQQTIEVLISAPSNPLGLSDEEVEDWKVRKAQLGSRRGSGSPTHLLWKWDIDYWYLESIRDEINKEYRLHEGKFRQAEEDATLQLLSRAHGASAFGGHGDLRMCGQCRTGPFENKACPQLDHRNDREFRKNSLSLRRPNDCPNCGWFHCDWTKWPKFDGIYGPH